MRSEIFPKLLLHHCLVIGPVANRYLSNEVTFEYNEIRADRVKETAVMKACGVLYTDGLTSPQEELQGE
jgi:hypothetical protein